MSIFNLIHRELGGLAFEKYTGAFNIRPLVNGIQFDLPKKDKWDIDRVRIWEDRDTGSGFGIQAFRTGFGNTELITEADYPEIKMTLDKFLEITKFKM